MAGDRAFEFEYLLAKLTEVEEALAQLDRQPDPLAHHESRKRLVRLQAQLAAAVAVYESPQRLN